jgi:predicted PurR-regulated permease PerM
MSNKFLGLLLLSLPFALILAVCIGCLGLVDGVLAFLLAMLATAIITLCVAKGIDLLGE